MVLDAARLRVEGVYEQQQAGNYMFRVKVPAGVISTEQAMKVADVADRVAGGRLHLTTRNSIEYHWVKGDDLSEAMRSLAAVGLISRGACGGAVRGIVCSTPFSPAYPVVQVLGQKLHRHFTGNPHFEGLPKKFKMAVNGDYSDPRYLIQDVALVYVGTDYETARYDLWTAGGLGREPSPGYLFEKAVPEERIIPLVEAIIRVYKERTPPPKRLKHLLREIGREEFERLVHEKLAGQPELSIRDAFEKRLTALPAGNEPHRVEAGVFAGELSSETLRKLAGIAGRFAAGYLVLTSTQNVAFLLPDGADPTAVRTALAEAGFDGTGRDQRTVFRICPGNHECKMGLSPTRDIARQLLEAMGDAGEGCSWAISGCFNSCSQPQLADVGIVTVKSVANPDGTRSPQFDLYRRTEEDGFGERIRERISVDELLEAVRQMNAAS